MNVCITVCDVCALCDSHPLNLFPYRRLVMPGSVVSVVCVICVVCQPGDYTILASIHSDKLTDIHGHTTIKIMPISSEQ